MIAGIDRRELERYGFGGSNLVIRRRFGDAVLVPAIVMV